jgi:hypothetical protein
VGDSWSGDGVVPDPWQEPEGWSARDDARRRAEIREQDKVRRQAERTADLRDQLRRRKVDPAYRFRPARGSWRAKLVTCVLAAVLGVISLAHHHGSTGRIVGAAFLLLSLCGLASLAVSAYRSSRSDPSEESALSG